MSQSRVATARTVEPTIRGPASGRFLQSFALPARDGREVRPRDFRQRTNLVLYFFHGAGCLACRDLLADLGAHAAELRASSAKVLAISAAREEAAPSSTAEFGPDIVVLDDPGHAAAAAQDVEPPAVVVADRFGEIWAAWEGDGQHRLPNAQDIIEWLEFIEIQCPECHPPEPWE